MEPAISIDADSKVASDCDRAPIELDIDDS